MKNKTLKIIVSVLAVAILAAVFVACTSQNGDNGEKDVPANDTAVVGGASGTMVLNENWKIRNDENDQGVALKWYNSSSGDDIDIPGNQWDVTSMCPIAWFSTKFRMDFQPSEGERVLLALGGISYRATVYLNGDEVGSHDGCYGAFTCDITDAVKFKTENVLAIRVESATDEHLIDGKKANQLPVWNSSPKIQERVYIYAKSAVYVTDATVVPNCENGEIKVTATVNNTTDSEKTLPATLTVNEKGKNFVIDKAEKEITCPAGTSTVEMTVKVDNFTYWSVDVPFLYEVNLNVGTDEYSVKTGFKTLCVDDEGYFVLNGKRIFIKCSHMCTHIPGSIDTTRDLSGYYDLLIYLKACGFNSIRFLQSPAFPEILDMCDEIGLLVYQEHAMSWQKVKCDETEELFTASVLDVLNRDKNHVSLGMFGMLNETEYVVDKMPIIDAARKVLKPARDCSPNTLFLFSSGRWDGNKAVGSASNPGSYNWDGYMGDESADAKDTCVPFSQAYWSLMYGSGDIHYYPRLPWGADEKKAIEKAASYDRAVFFSETGAGSIVNVVSDYLTMLQNKTIIGGTPWNVVSGHYSKYIDFYDQYGLYNVFETPEAALKASEEYQTKQRALILSYIRRCAKFNGYSVTMSADVGFRGEGIMNTSGDFKSGVTDMFHEGFADLRFCVTIDNPCVYAGENVPLNIVLSNFEVLDKKEYNVVIRVTGDDGLVWTKSGKIKPGADGYGMSVPVYDGKIETAGFSTGKYTVGIEFVGGAHPTCGNAEFYVVNKNDKGRISGTVYTLGVPSDVKSVLSGAGAKLADFTDGASVGKSTVYVGSSNISNATADKLYAAAKNGAHIVFLNADAINRGESGYYVPFENKGYKDVSDNWLYHADSFIYKNSVTKNLPNRCILDTDYYSPVYTTNFVSGMSVPTDPSVICVYTGNDGGSNKAFQSGYQLGTYAYGSGHITISTLELEKNTRTPSTDNILINLANYVEPAYCKDRVHY